MIQRKLALTVFAVVLMLASVASAEERPKSPPGMASTQIGDAWIDVTYSRPILRGRTEIFGSGEEYGKTVNGSGDYWRAGANATTQLETEIDLMVGDTKVPAGKYGVIIKLEEKAWTLVLTTQETMESFTSREDIAKGILWGAYGYKPEFDAARAPMPLMHLDHSVDQMTISFLDVSDEGATLAVAWDKTVGTVRLKVAK